MQGGSLNRAFFFWPKRSAGATSVASQAVHPCDEDERGAHSEKNAMCGHTREKTNRVPKNKDA